QVLRLADACHLGLDDATPLSQRERSKTSECGCLESKNAKDVPPPSTSCRRTSRLSVPERNAPALPHSADSDTPRSIPHRSRPLRAPLPFSARDESTPGNDCAASFSREWLLPERVGISSLARRAGCFLHGRRRHRRLPGGRGSSCITILE